jgi:hypothetical protein
MKKINYRELASGLDMLYADRVRDIYKETIMNYSRTFDECSVQNQLQNWEEAGCIQIIKPLAECEDMEPCIKLLGWIQPRS